MKKKKTKMSVDKIAKIGAGVAAVGTGAYYLFGPKGKQHQKKMSILAADVKKEVKKEFKKVKSVTKPLCRDAVDAVVKDYNKKNKNYSGKIKASAKKLKTRPTLKKIKRTVKKVT